VDLPLLDISCQWISHRVASMFLPLLDVTWFHDPFSQCHQVHSRGLDPHPHPPPHSHPAALSGLKQRGLSSFPLVTRAITVHLLPLVEMFSVA
jgi:hypothetical protein